jgi:hypothetical protein
MHWTRRFYRACIPWLACAAPVMCFVMSEQFSILDVKFRNGPEVECRTIVSSVTGAHIAGLPLRSGEEHTVSALQNLPTRVEQYFAGFAYVVIEPSLLPHSSGSLAGPKVEHMGFLFAPSRDEGLTVVWYESEGEPLLSAENRKKIEGLNWNSLAKRVEHEAYRT